MDLSKLADMSSGKDSLRTAALAAKKEALRPLAEESEQTLGLDARQLEEMEGYLHDAWLFGIKTSHKVMVETKMGITDPSPVIAGMQDEFQELMEAMAEALNTTIAKTIAAWSLLGRAWIAGARFWEVEIAARLIEAHSSSLDQGLQSLEE